MVLFVGDVASDQRDREAFQEVDYRQLLRPQHAGHGQAGGAHRRRPAHPEYVARAFATAMNGRPGPVVLVLPEDMLTKPSSRTAAPVLPQAQWSRQAWSDPGACAPARAAAGRAAPVRDCGRWRLDAAGRAGPAALCRKLASCRWATPSAFRTPSTTTTRCTRATWASASTPSWRAHQGSDLIIAIGPRLGEMTTGGYTLLAAPGRAKLVHIHASAEELNRVYQADLASTPAWPAARGAGSAGRAGPACPGKTGPQAAPCRLRGQMQPPGLARPHGHARHRADAAKACCRADAVLTNGAGNFASWLHRFYRYTGWPRAQDATGAHQWRHGLRRAGGHCAPSPPAAVAFTIAGDGDFLMNGQELATAVQYGAKSIIVLLNNGMYGTIRMHQEREYPQHVSGSQLQQPRLCRPGPRLRLCRCAHHRAPKSSSPSCWRPWREPRAP
jgi:acetolactate synthase-1/2/3 large subunit